MSQKDDELLKLTSYVEISKYREKTLKSIGNNVKIQENGFSFSIEGEILCEEQIAVPEHFQAPQEESLEGEENKNEETM